MTDLHCHTTASDGILSPSALIDMAASAGVSLLAVADHDCVDGLFSACERAQECGVRLITALEFSVEWQGGDFHLLGYGIDPENEELLAGLRRLRLIRETRVPVIVDRLCAAGVPLTLEEVMAEAAGAVPGKPHVARALVRKGLADDFAQAFDLWLSKGKPGNVPKEKIPPAEAFKLIHKAGGVAVVAHPVTLGLPRPQFGEFLGRFIPEGLAGIEAYAEMHTDDDVLLYLSAASHAGLFVTGGSDFHGDKNERLGCYGSGRVIPDVCGKNLLAALGL
jgi:predicted metal-dependent phosphoesterase TrpH